MRTFAAWMGLNIYQGRSFIVSVLLNAESFLSRYVSRFPLAFFVLSYSLFVQASVSNTLPSDSFEAQRQQFLTIEEKLNTLPSRRLDELDGAIYSLSSYPLYPYLLRKKLERTLSLKNRDNIEAFLNDYAGQPASYGLRYRWLSYLASRNHQQAFLHNYRGGMGAKLTCIALNYRFQNAEDAATVLSEVDNLWYHGQSQPDECDPLFKAWRKAGMMTPEKVIKRIEIAAKEKNRAIIPYLKRQLPKEYHYIGDAWYAVTRNTNAVNTKRLFPLKHTAYEAEILTWAIEKLAWSHAEKAAKAYTHYQAKSVFSQPQQHMMRRAIALSFTLGRKPESHEWLERADIEGANDDVKRWHIAHLLRNKQWQEVIDIINSAPQYLQDEENYRYWRARALEEQGNTMQATVLYTQLAQERHYYGFMASAHVGALPHLAHESAVTNNQKKQKIVQTPATLRALEFYRLARFTSARREWHYLLSILPKSDITEAGILAYEWGVYDQAITSFARSGEWDDVERRFPLAFNDAFTQKSAAYDIDKAFAMAIARRESSFRADAVSPVGAAGLMQIMPGTAQYLAKQKVSRNTLFQVDDNVEYGVQYLRYLMDKLDNNPVLVSASYNAGWRKVLEWLPANESLPVDIWIENIPYRETRHYVKAVLAYQHIYEQQLGLNQNMFPSLTKEVIPSAQSVTTNPDTGRLQLAPR